jgi:hypothetical protein
MPGDMKFEIYNMGLYDAITIQETLEIVINELSLNAADKRFIEKFDGRGWKGDVKEYLLDCSKIKTIGWRAENNSMNAVILTVKGYINK